jgi:hypothetical protein
MGADFWLQSCVELKTIFRLAAQRVRGVFGQQIGELVMTILPTRLSAAKHSDS